MTLSSPLTSFAGGPAQRALLRQLDKLAPPRPRASPPAQPAPRREPSGAFGRERARLIAAEAAATALHTTLRQVLSQDLNQDLTDVAAQRGDAPQRRDPHAKALLTAALAHSAHAHALLRTLNERSMRVAP